ERVVSQYEGLTATLRHGGDRSVEVMRASGLDLLQLHLQVTSSLLHRLQRRLHGWVCRIEEDSETGEGRGVHKHFDPLAHQFWELVLRARDVTAWTREAWDDSRRHGVTDQRHDHRNRSRGLLGSKCPRRPVGD